MYLNDMALVIVDMQRYYLENNSVFSQYSSREDSQALSYIHNRCFETVLPNIIQLLNAFRQRNKPVVFLRLCGTKEDRSDLHQLFRRVHLDAQNIGFDGVYPLESDEMSGINPMISPLENEKVICKTTFSPFVKKDFEKHLLGKAKTLVFTGLATSQCVETTARDASDRGFEIIHIEDAQADYDDITHASSLWSSRGVCGGAVTSTETFLKFFAADI